MSKNDVSNLLQPVLHPIYGRLLCAEMQSRGFTPEQILAGTSLSWDRFHEVSDFLSFEQMRRLILHCMKLAECPWLGIDVGLRTQASSHGALGAAMGASRNLGDAMRVAERYAFFRQHMVTMHWVTGPEPYIAVNEVIPLGDLREFLLCLLVAGLKQVLGALAGKQSQALVRIEWSFPAHEWSGQYLRICDNNRFGQSQLRFYLDPASLAVPSLSADDDALQSAVRECELQLSRAQTGSTFSHKVRSFLLRSEASLPTLNDMAERENMSPRTFIRHLKSENTSYQMLLDDVRQARATWLLEQTSHSIESIASQLGYIDTSNFSRTFRRWFGLTPNQYRKKFR
ncbi:MAG: AraC family transcriptional regulator ligand-binding domain-containing protein [Moraxellaceae bacterium]|nr:AraC family transcriptional regulator ligand-binding domain-containing protein [Moraxellaceae bacterium]